MKNFVKYHNSNYATSEGAIWGLVASFIYSATVSLLAWVAVMIDIWRHANGFDNLPTLLLMSAFGLVFYGLFGTFIGTLIFVVPSIFIGVFAGWAIDVAISKFFEKLSNQKALQMGLVIALGITIIIHLIVVKIWFNPLNLADPILVITYLLLLGAPSIVFIILGGRFAQRLYTQKSKQFDLPLKAEDATESQLVNDIYSPTYIKSLFDEMSGTYDMVNYITSFGFSKRWRQQCVQQLALASGMQSYDLMTGMGEGWVYLVQGIGREGKIKAIDISPNMLKHAHIQREKLAEYDIEVIEGDALQNNFADNSADCIVCLFGVKTLSDEQKAKFALEIQRILKPGGQYSLIEVSVPNNWLLRTFYMFYLKYGIPLLGKILLGNPDNYRMLGRYTELFGNCKTMGQILTNTGLQAQYAEYFYGCATGVWGKKQALGAA